jgi:hypothetical protein
MGPEAPPVSESPDAQGYECDACGKRCEGEPGGHGLYVWTRGDEVRYEEPPLCNACANAIGLAAMAQWELEEDGD